MSEHIVVCIFVFVSGMEVILDIIECKIWASIYPTFPTLLPSLFLLLSREGTTVNLLQLNNKTIAAL